MSGFCELVSPAIVTLVPVKLADIAGGCGGSPPEEGGGLDEPLPPVGLSPPPHAARTSAIRTTQAVRCDTCDFGAELKMFPMGAAVSSLVIRRCSVTSDTSYVGRGIQPTPWAVLGVYPLTMIEVIDFRLWAGNLLVDNPSPGQDEPPEGEIPLKAPGDPVDPPPA